MDSLRSSQAQARRSWRQPPFSDGVCVCVTRAGDCGDDERVLWRPDWDKAIVAVDAERVPPDHPEAFDIADLPGAIDLLADPAGGEVALFGEGARHFELVVAHGSLGEGPVRLRYQLEGFTSLEDKLLTLRRLSALRRLGRYPVGLFLPEPAARKWVFALQAFDGWRAGASQRDIAAVLFGEARVTTDWRGVSDSLRLRLRRALNLARRLVDGGYRDLLH